MMTAAEIRDALLPVLLDEGYVAGEMPRLYFEAFTDRLVAAVYEAQTTPDEVAS